MSVIAPDEKADFLAILARRRLEANDFLVQEADTSDIVDDVYPLQGIVRQSTRKEREYRVGHGTHWTTEFEQDLNKGAFG
ncbi:hypothetical protein BUMB_03843c [Candidatus Paraburkholderia calva]|nr:hypothetical protein BUMB_03843c [Candidatus Paraburkholderia calva]